MILDGRHIADEIVSGLGDTLRGMTLGIVMNAGDPATRSFVKIKTRVAERLGVVVKEYTPADSAAAVAECDAVVVQLPIEGADALLAQVPHTKDVDNYPVAPVAAAVAEILARTNVDPNNKKVVVVGEGKLVGAPVAQLLRAMGANVSVVTLEQGSLDELKDADIVVSGAGSPGLIRPETLKQGVVLIDAGTSESAGKLAGDCDPRCAEVARVFTPVPGGVGPIAVAMLFKNLLTLDRHDDGLAGRA